MKYSILFFLFFFKLAIRCEKKKKTSGWVRALNLTVPLGSGRVGSGRVRRSRVRAGFGLQFKARADLYSLGNQTERPF